MTKRSRQIQQAPRTMTKRQRARWEREQTLNRRIIIGVGAVLAIAIVAVVVGLVWDRVYLPNRTVASIGNTNISRGEYLRLRKLTLVQQISETESQMSQYDAFLQQMPEDQREAFSQQLATQRQQSQAQIQMYIDELRSLRSAPINHQFLGQLIKDQLVLQGAEREGISVSDDEVDADLAEIFAPPMPPSPSATPVTSTNTLTSTDTLTGTSGVTATGDITGSEAISPTATATLTPAEAESAVVSGVNDYHNVVTTQFLQRYGIELDVASEELLDFYRRSKRVELLTERVKDKLVTEVPTSLQVNAAHILFQVTVPTTATDSPTETKELEEELFAEAKAEADKVYQELKQGADFAELAKQYSDDSSAENGGELGWSTPDQYVPEFKEAVETQPIGEIGEPVRTQYGWHIIKVLGREEREDESKLDAERNEAFEKWVEEQREHFPVQRFPEPTPLPPTQPVPTPEGTAAPEGTTAPEGTGALDGTEEITSTSPITE